MLYSLLVPPRESVYAILDNVLSLYIVILYDNPEKIEEQENVVYTAMRESDISPCAKPKFFRRISVYEVVCRGKNVLIKFSSDNKLELRSGKGRRMKYKAVGMFSNVLSNGSSSPKKDEASAIDFASNVQVIEKIFEG
jgi:hypothetical protein